MGGRGGSFDSVYESETYRDALSKAEGDIKNDGVETAILLDKHGNTLFTESQGNVDSVYFTPDQVNQMKDATLTHNHPSGSTFSVADIDLLVYSDLRELRATSRDQTYRLQRMKGQYPDRLQFAQDFANARQSNKAVLDAKYQKIASDYFGAGRISWEEYADRCAALDKELNSMNSQWLKNNSRRYGYRYGITRRQKR